MYLSVRSVSFITVSCENLLAPFPLGMLAKGGCTPQARIRMAFGGAIPVKTKKWASLSFQFVVIRNAGLPYQIVDLQKTLKNLATPIESLWKLLCLTVPNRPQIPYSFLGGIL